MSNIIDAAKTLVECVEFDVNGTMGKGGNGGLISDATIKSAGALRIALSRNGAPAPVAPEVVTEGRRGDWMQTVSGRQFWPLDPRPDDVFIEDIAHALSMMCRFNGHCERFYSVAEHSVLVSENVPPEDALWALLHDASEAYIADIVRPAKRFIDGYRQMEANIMAAVCGAFDLPYIEPPSVKRADNAILADEASQIMGSKPKDWILPEPPLGVRIIGLSPAGAKLAFLNRYRALTEGAAHG